MGDGPGAGQGHRQAAGQARQLMRQQWRVGGDRRDDRALVAATAHFIAADMTADRHAGDHQFRA